MIKTNVVFLEHGLLTNKIGLSIRPGHRGVCDNQIIACHGQTLKQDLNCELNRPLRCLIKLGCNTRSRIKVPCSITISETYFPTAFDLPIISKSAMQIQLFNQHLLFQKFNLLFFHLRNFVNFFFFFFKK